MSLTQTSETSSPERPINYEVVYLAERSEVLLKSISNLEERLVSVSNPNQGDDSDKKNIAEENKASSPMKGRLSTISGHIDHAIYLINSQIAKLEI